jgi:hypothetical protein
MRGEVHVEEFLFFSIAALTLPALVELPSPHVCTRQDHFEEATERAAFFRNIHRPLKLWYAGKGPVVAAFGPFPQFWQVLYGVRRV